MLKIIHANVGHPLAKILQNTTLLYAPLDVQRVMRNYAAGLCRASYINAYERDLITHFADAFNAHNLNAISEWSYQQAFTFYAVSLEQLPEALKSQQTQFREHLSLQLQRKLLSIQLDETKYH